MKNTVTGIDCSTTITNSLKSFEKYMKLQDSFM